MIHLVKSRPVDTRIAYGVHCTWWGGIAEVGTRRSAAGAMPCCPHCKNVLFEMPDEKTWFENVEKYAADGHPGYVALMLWLRGKCFPTFQDAERAYAAEKGTTA